MKKLVEFIKNLFSRDSVISLTNTHKAALVECGGNYCQDCC